MFKTILDRILKLVFKKNLNVFKKYPSFQGRYTAGILTGLLVSSSIMSMIASFKGSLSVIIIAIAPDFSAFTALVVKEQSL